MHIFRTFTALIALGSLAVACGAKDPLANTSTEAGDAPEIHRTEAAVRPANQLTSSAKLPEKLDCVRENGAALVIAHRGGPNRSHPENAIESFERSMQQGASGIELDIAQTKDGVLFLMHDDNLERTSTGEGPIEETSWVDIEKLQLETYSQTTDFHPPTLDAALSWVRKSGALVELDRKRSTSFDAVVSAVEAHNAQANVLVITYNDEQAVEVHQRSRDLVITASIDSIEHLDRLIARGVDPERLIAWAGTERPDPSLWKQLRSRGIEIAFGTLGPRGSRLDDLYWSDDNGDEYARLVADGASIIVTDMSDRVSRELRTFQSTAKSCGL